MKSKKDILDTHLKAYQNNFIYEFDNKIQLNWYPKRVLEHSKGAKTVLELGLGHGITTNLFAKHFDRYLVLDASPAVIENFKTKFSDCKAEVIETYFEEFESVERFDVIILGFVLEHVDDPVKILSHYKKFLKPEGKVFISVPNAEVMNRTLGHIAGLLPDMQLLSEHDHICGHQRYYTVKTLSEDIIKTGYKITRIEGIYLKPLTTSQMISLNLDEKIIDALCQLGIKYPELCCGILAEIRL